MSYADPTKAIDPAVTVEVAGMPARLVVDTGAIPTILTQAFVRRSMALTEAEVPGRAVVPVSIGDVQRATMLLPVAVVPAIAEFDGDGLAGLLSPLSVGREMVVVLDFPGRFFWALPPDRARTTLDAIYGSKMKKSVLRRVPAAFGVLVHASLAGKPDTVMDIDTGKSHSALCDDYIGPDARRRAGPRQKTFTGDVTISEVVEAQHLVLGTTVHDVDVIVQSRPKEIAGIRWCGNLGMDVMRSFVLVIFPGPEGEVLLYGPEPAPQ